MSTEQEYRDFDPHHNPDPFQKRPPWLPEQATDNQRQLAEKYTRISYIVVPDELNKGHCVPDASVAWLVVGSQYFRVSNPACDNRDEASWMCWMVAKAIELILVNETNGTYMPPEVAREIQRRLDKEPIVD